MKNTAQMMMGFKKLRGKFPRVGAEHRTTCHRDHGQWEVRTRSRKMIHMSGGGGRSRKLQGWELGNAGERSQIREDTDRKGLSQIEKWHRREVCTDLEGEIRSLLLHNLRPTDHNI